MKHAVWLFILPAHFAQLLPLAFSCHPPLHAHSALPSAALKTIFSIHCVSFPTSDFLHWLGGCHHCGFIQSLLTATNTWRRRRGKGQQRLWCPSTAPADWLNRASNKGQPPAMFNLFANNKARKKSQKQPLLGYQKMVRYRAAMSSSDRVKEDTSGGTAIQMVVPDGCSLKWDMASRNAIERADFYSCV